MATPTTPADGDGARSDAEVRLEAIAFVQALLDGDGEGVGRTTGAAPGDEALLRAVGSVAATLARTVALYGDVSASDALSLVALDDDAGGGSAGG